MGTKIKALQTMVGDYGRLRAGQTAVVKNSTAKQLVGSGMAVVVSENVPEPEPAKVEDHIDIAGYQANENESKPVLAETGEEEPEVIENPEDSEKSDNSDEQEKTELPESEPEKAESKKEITEPATGKKKQKEVPKKEYK